MDNEPNDPNRPLPNDPNRTSPNDLNNPSPINPSYKGYIFIEKQLDDGPTLSDYNIGKELILYLIIYLEEYEMYQSMVPSDDEPIDTIQNKEGIPRLYLLYIFNGK